MYILGSTIDYQESLAGSMLVVDNPQAKSSCGCGVSVNI
jgi:iron-sulfur cluster insertion protein